MNSGREMKGLRGALNRRCDRHIDAINNIYRLRDCKSFRQLSVFGKLPTSGRCGSIPRMVCQVTSTILTWNDEHQTMPNKRTMDSPMNGTPTNHISTLFTRKYEAALEHHHRNPSPRARGRLVVYWQESDNVSRNVD